MAKRRSTFHVPRSTSHVEDAADCKDRRDFLKTTMLGGAAVALHPGTFRDLTHPHEVLDGEIPFRLGIASYSLREFSRADAIEMILALGAESVSIKSFHLPYDDSPEDLAAGVGQFESAGIKAVSCGVVYFEDDTDAGVQKYFDYARAAGIPVIVMSAAPEIMPRIERFVKSYDISVAIHNHGPEDPHYPNPSDAIRTISGMDPRVGVCIDVGHTARTGADVVAEITEAGDRLLDIHLKDMVELTNPAEYVAVGAGAMPVAAIFDQLRNMNYTGNVNLEYEIDPEDPLAGMMQSMAYMRGVVAGLTHP